MKKILSLGFALMVLTLSARGADTPKEKTADELWQSILQAIQLPPAHDRAELLERLGPLHGDLLEFERRFPSDSRRWEVKLVRWQVEAGLARAEDQPVDNASLFALAKEMAAASDAATDTKADTCYLAAGKRLEVLAATGSVTNGPARAAADAAIQELRQKYPDDLRTLQIQFDMAGLLKADDSAAAEAIFHELETSKNPQASAMAHMQLVALATQRKLAKEPLDLKFQAVDGTQVDVAKMRGKVVLLDFWATWCGPCRAELPNVLATYKEFHSRGFEIIGISLDQDKGQMVKLAETAGMTWPQYFDGKDFRGDMAVRFGISSIPTMWLLDKKGMVRSMEARGPELEQQVKKLLAE